MLPAQVAELADLPIDRVRAAIRDGQARPGVRDLAGWVVHLLRNTRDHGWPIPAPMPRSDSPEALRASFHRYAAEQARERQAEPIAALVADAPPADLDPPGLWDAARERLRAQIPRREFARWLRGVDLLALTDGVATIRAPSMAAKLAIEERYLGQLRADLAQLAGHPLTVRVALSGAGIARMSGADESAAHGAGADDARPAWIAPAQWAALPALLRAALRGAMLEGDAIRTTSPHIDRLIHARYARELAVLIAASPP